VAKIMMENLQIPKGASAVLKKLFARMKYLLQPTKINPIIVYQMGKVGSKTIEASLYQYFEQQNLRVDVYHTHNLINLSQMERNILANKDRPNPKATISQIRKDARLREIIDKNPKKRWNLISLARDPIAQNIGAFFHNMKEFIPDWKEKYESGNLDLENLQRIYLEKYNHQATKRWFETQMEPMWNIDIYSAPFDREKGFSIYRAPKADLLLIRLESLNECAAQAFSEFLNFINFHIVNKNIGEEKEYKALYREFKAYPLPDDFVEDMYNSRFANHFYSEHEIEEFKKYWLKR
jgi:hypothetical protein